MAVCGRRRRPPASARVLAGLPLRSVYVVTTGHATPGSAQPADRGCGSLPRMALKQSPLHDRHVALGAKLAEFGGWEMPLEYPTGVLKEHTAVREAVGIFDVSHLGKVDGARRRRRGVPQRDCLSNDLGRIGPGQAQYTLVLRRRDRRRRRRPDRLLLRRRPRAARAQRRQHRRGRAAGSRPASPTGVTITDHHETHAVLAVQGAEVRRGARGASACRPATATCPSWRHPFDGRGRRRLPHRLHRRARLRADRRRTRWRRPLWDALLAAGEEHGILPCGLGARDTLRTEMGYPLHGQDICLDVTPNQARLGWAVGWKKPAFWGRSRCWPRRRPGSAMPSRPGRPGPRHRAAAA